MSFYFVFFTLLKEFITINASADATSLDSKSVVNSNLEDYSYYVEENTVPSLVTPVKLGYTKTLDLIINMSSRIFHEKKLKVNPMRFEDFLNNFNSSFIFLINFLSANATKNEQDSRIYFHEIKVPIFLQNNLSSNVFVTRFNSSNGPIVLRKNVHHQLLVFIVPIDFSVAVRKTVEQYFRKSYRNYGYHNLFDIKPLDSSAKNILYLFGSRTKQQDNNASIFPLESKIRFGAAYIESYALNTNISNIFGVSTAGNPTWEVYTGVMSSEGIVLKLFYVCLYCEYRRFHLHEISGRTPQEIKQKTFEVTLSGLKYTWMGWYSDSGTDIAGLPYLEEMSSREIISKEDINLERILLRFLLTGSNYTKYLNYTDHYYMNDDIGKAIIITHISNVPEFHLQRVFFDHDSYNFISCHGVKVSQHGFAVYFAPFETPVWIMILVSLISAPGALSCVLYFRYKLRIAPYFRFLFYALSSSFITQYPCGRGETIKLLPFRNAYRLVYGAFLLACLTLVNMYVGLIITDITSPLPVRHEHEKLETLEDSLLIAPLYEDTVARRQLEFMINNSKIMNKTRERKQRDIYSVIYSPLGYEIYMAIISESGCYPYINHLWSSKHFEKLRNNRTHIPPYCWNLMSLFTQIDPVTDPLERIGLSLTANHCKEKNFYLLLNSEIDYKWTQLTAAFDNVPFYKGKSTFFTHVRGWKVSTFGGSKGAMAKRLETLVSSGIYGYFKQLVEFSEWRSVNRMSAIKSRNIYEPYTLQYAALTFFVFLICHLISLVALFIEFILFKSKPTNDTNSYQYGNLQTKIMFIAPNQTSSAYIN